MVLSFDILMSGALDQELDSDNEQPLPSMNNQNELTVPLLEQDTDDNRSGLDIPIDPTLQSQMYMTCLK